MKPDAQSRAWADIVNRPTCTVEEAGAALGIGRGAAYRAVRRGEIPHLALGRRVLVKVPALLELVGVPPDMREAAPASAATAQIISSATKEVQTHVECPPDTAA